MWLLSGVQSGVIIPHYWGKTSLSTLPKTPRVFPSWLVGIGSPCSVRVLLPLIFLDGPLPSLGSFSIMHALINTLLNTPGGPSADFWGSRSVQPSLLQHSVWWSLTALVSSADCQSVSSTQSIFWSLLQLPLPVPWPGNSLKAGSLDDCRAYLICFLSEISLSFIAWCPVSWNLLVHVLLQCWFLALGIILWLYKILMSWKVGWRIHKHFLYYFCNFLWV